MPANAPQMTAVTCPACRAQYTAPVHSVIDVGRDPRLKTLILQGRLNVGVCPQCGTAGVLGVPVTYHDPDKELLLVLVPQELRITESQRQRIIGEMSNSVINSLPTEQRRGYLLRPRIFLTLQSMLEAILEADGVTKDMLQGQQEKGQLIAEMIKTIDDPLRLAALIGEAGNKIDSEFFQILSLSIRTAQEDAQSETVGKLTRLRQTLLDRTATGQRIAAQQRAFDKALQGIDGNLTREDLLERVISIEGEQQESILTVLLALGRQLVDYRFFQLLTERIDQAKRDADAAAEKRLTALRDTVLDVTQKLDTEAREHTRQKAVLLGEIAQSANPKAAIQEHLDEIDSLFMSVLETNIEQSELQHRQEAADAFRSIRDLIVQVLEDSAPAELKLIDELLRADYPDGTRKILSDNQTMVNSELVELMEVLVQDLADRGETQTGERLTAVRAQAQLMLK